MSGADQVTQRVRRPHAVHRPRRALVLGAGGMLGFAWSIGALCALEEAEGYDANAVDLIVGTSAGSALAAMLACGVAPTTLLNHLRGIPDDADTGTALDLAYDYDAQRSRPPLPAARLGSSRLLVRTLTGRQPVSTLGLLAAFAPLGRGSLSGLRDVIAAAAPDGWPADPQLWVVAMDYDSGERVTFGRDGQSALPLPDAVVASCAIPGWFAPVSAGGRRYVDGGSLSITSTDLLAGLGLDEVTVLAPMAAFAYDEPQTRIGRAERRMRRAWTRSLLREAETVRRSGTGVTLLAPGAEDLAAMGVNMMDPSRRSLVLETSLRTTAAALAERAEVDEAGLLAG
jgi:NTE family protein